MPEPRHGRRAVGVDRTMVVPMFIAVPVDTIGDNKHCAGVKLFAVDTSPN